MRLLIASRDGRARRPGCARRTASGNGQVTPVLTGRDSPGGMSPSHSPRSECYSVCAAEGQLESERLRRCPRRDLPASSPCACAAYHQSGPPCPASSRSTAIWSPRSARERTLRDRHLRDRTCRPCRQRRGLADPQSVVAAPARAAGGRRPARHRRHGADAQVRPGRGHPGAPGQRHRCGLGRRSRGGPAHSRRLVQRARQRAGQRADRTAGRAPPSPPPRRAPAAGARRPPGRAARSPGDRRGAPAGAADRDPRPERRSGRRAPGRRRPPTP